MEYVNNNAKIYITNLFIIKYHKMKTYAFIPVKVIYLIYKMEIYVQIIADKNINQKQKKINIFVHNAHKIHLLKINLNIFAYNLVKNQKLQIPLVIRKYVKISVVLTNLFIKINVYKIVHNMMHIQTLINNHAHNIAYLVDIIYKQKNIVQKMRNAVKVKITNIYNNVINNNVYYNVKDIIIYKTKKIFVQNNVMYNHIYIYKISNVFSNVKLVIIFLQIINAHNKNHKIAHIQLFQQLFSVYKIVLIITL